MKWTHKVIIVMDDESWNVVLLRSTYPSARSTATDAIKNGFDDGDEFFPAHRISRIVIEECQSET